MNDIIERLSNEVSDSDLEYVERLLFYEFNDALEKKQDGLEASGEIMQLERAMESITVLRESLKNHRLDKAEETAEQVNSVLDDEFAAD